MLRDRKKMKAKIQAMSMEAKASAAHHRRAAVRRRDDLVWITSPQLYRAAVVRTDSATSMLASSATAWMLMGVLVMNKMINFDF